MDVPAHRHWRIDAGEVGLFDQDVFGLIAEHFDAGFFYERVAFSFSQDLLHNF